MLTAYYLGVATGVVSLMLLVLRDLCRRVPADYHQSRVERWRE